jgi:hypothetical protein
MRRLMFCAIFMGVALLLWYLFVAFVVYDVVWPLAAAHWSAATRFWIGISLLPALLVAFAAALEVGTATERRSR